MPNDLTFLDLVLLEKIQGDTVMETFSGIIGTSFFETAEVMGKMKIKGIIDIVPTIGKSVLKKTQVGEQTLKTAEMKSQEHLDELDHAVLKTIASGANEFNRLQEQMNIRSEDLAYRIYKITKQGYVDYDIKNARTYLSLTENGFKLTGVVPKLKMEQTTLPSVAKEVGKEARKMEAPKMSTKAIIASEEDATKNLPITMEPVDIKKKQAELQLFRILKTAVIVIIIAGIAYLTAKYLGYL